MGKWVKLTHAACRERVCFVCSSNSNVKFSFKSKPGIQEKLASFFKISFSSGVFDLNDSRVPCGLCSNCSSKLYKGTPMELLYDNFDHVILSNSEPCSCWVCLIAKQTFKSNLKHQSSKKSAGRPFKKVPSCSTRCDNCYAPIGPEGLANHICSNAKFIAMARRKFHSPASSAARLGEQVASMALKETDKSPGGTWSLKQLHGQNLKLSAGPAKAVSPKQKISVDDMLTFQVQNNLSDTAVRKLATFSNSKVGKGTVEKDFQAKLASRYSHFDCDFVCTPTLFQVSGGKTPTFEELPLVHCKNLGDFALKIFYGASLAPQHFQLKLGIDKGDNCLKLALSFVCVSPLANPRPNEVFIVAMVEDIPENYHNIQTILRLIVADDASFIWSGDLKMLNVLSGVQPHSCNHPCHLCEQPKESLHLYTAPQRTLGLLVERYETYLSSNKNTRVLNQKACNVKHYPLIASDPLDPSQASMPVYQLVPPPELHLMEGPTNDIFQDIQDNFPFIAKKWVHLVRLPKEAMHGGIFNGNGCKLLLANADILESLAIQNECFGLIPYVRILRAFNAVVHSCFGIELDHDYQSKILEFKKAILFSNTCLSIKSKLHIIWHHVPEYLEWRIKGGQQVGLGLGKVSEQDIERLHQQFFKYSSRYLIWSKNPRYLSRATRAVSTFNAKKFHLFVQAHSI